MLLETHSHKMVQLYKLHFTRLCCILRSTFFCPYCTVKQRGVKILKEFQKSCGSDFKVLHVFCFFVCCFRWVSLLKIVEEGVLNWNSGTISSLDFNRCFLVPLHGSLTASPVLVGHYIVKLLACSWQASSRQLGVIFSPFSEKIGIFFKITLI